jgi:hypothetical protein
LSERLALTVPSLLVERQRLEMAEADLLAVLLPALAAVLVARVGAMRAEAGALVAIVLLVGLGQPTTQPMAALLPEAVAGVAVVALWPFQGAMQAAAGVALAF